MNRIKLIKHFANYEVGEYELQSSGRLDGAYGLFTTRDGTIVNIGAMQERVERNGEYQIA